jgi:DNA mismatch repair protein MutS
MSITEEYIKYHKDYIKKFGEKTLVLMQVGSFFELYSISDSNLEYGPNLKDISSLLNIIYTKKDKSIKEVSIKNPYMIGFPLISSDKFITLLTNNGFTIVLIEQTTSPPDPKREVTNIYSPSTYVGDTVSTNTNYAVNIYIEYISQRKKDNIIKNLCCGVCAIDISTGKVIIHEGLPTSDDETMGLDDISRFINAIQPREIFITINGSGKYDVKYIINYLQLEENNIKTKKYDAKYEKITYQEEFLKNIYNYKLDGTQISIIETLNLEKKPFGLISFIMMIDYLQNYSNKLIKGLNIPESINSDTLFLGNNAIYQLSILEVDNYNYSIGTKIKSLYDTVNNTSSNIGSRYLKHRLLNPFTDIQTINKYLNLSEIIIKNKIYDTISNNLNGLSDIEKLKRKMCFSILHPYELYEFIDTLNNITKLNVIIKENNLKSIKLTKETQDELNKFNEYIITIFDVDKLKQNTLNDLKSNFFIKGVFKDIDDISEIFSKQYVKIQELKNKFEDVLNEKTKTKVNKKSNNQINKNMIIIESTSSEGYYMVLSKIRYSVLLKNKLITEDLMIKELKSCVKIFIKDYKCDNKDIKDIEDDLLYLVKTHYYEEITKIHNIYNKLFTDLIKYIGEIDYVTNNAKIAVKYNYCKPSVSNDSNISNMSCKQLRHPIVERIIDYEYIPHDISIGKDLKGMLIYGLNSSGKSVLMKAIGLSVVMAQCGMYVPAVEYNLIPYKSLYTRITGNDNIFKGLSSFNLEVTELSIILKRSCEDTLIIGDEICRGTEHISGNAIVASSIVHLSNKKASFVFATHLHELIHLESIKKLDNVKAYHLSVDYDTQKDILIYDRKLKEGSGDKIYGIIVAKYIIKDNAFMEMTNKIKNELTKSFDTMISGKTSRYNSSVYVYKCELCGLNDVNSDISPRSLLESHHINEQKDCENGFSKNKPHIAKNSKANLIVICEKCHDKVHNKEINIEGYVMTSSGKKPKVKKITDKHIH